jgi:hypothetical protein
MMAAVHPLRLTARGEEDSATCGVLADAAPSSEPGRGDTVGVAVPLAERTMVAA